MYPKSFLKLLPQFMVEQDNKEYTGRLSIIGKVIIFSVVTIIVLIIQFISKNG